MYYWHFHHDVLVENVGAGWIIGARIEHIKTSKPKHERELRLKLLKPVINQEVLKGIHNLHGGYGVSLTNDELQVISDLHAVECLDCPWISNNDEYFKLMGTIFP